MVDDDVLSEPRDKIFGWSSVYRYVRYCKELTSFFQYVLSSMYYVARASNVRDV